MDKIKVNTAGLLQVVKREFDEIVPGIVQLDDGENLAPANTGIPFTIYASINNEVERAVVRVPPELWDRVQVDNLPIRILKQKKRGRLKVVGTDDDLAPDALEGEPIPANWPVLFGGEPLPEDWGGSGTTLTLVAENVPIVQGSSSTLKAAEWTASSLVVGGGDNTAPTFLAPSTSGFIVQSNGTAFVSSALNLDTNGQITGTLALANGGSNANLSGLTTGAVVVKDSTAILTAANWTANNLIVGAGTGAPTFLAPGTNRNAVLSNGTVWQSRALVNADLPTIDVSHGGTGLTTLTANNVILGNGTSNVTFVAPGTNRNALLSDGTTWASRALVDADIPNALTISGGTIDNSAIGATTPSSGVFNALTVTLSTNLQQYVAGSSAWIIRRSAASTQPGLSIQRSLGSDLDNESVLTSGVVVGAVDFKGWDTNDYNLAAMIQAVTTEAFTSTARGTKLEFLTTNNGSTTTSVRLRVLQNGTLEVVNDFAHLGGSFGVYNTTPAVRRALAAASGTDKRTTFNTATVTLAELAGVMKVVIDDFREKGFFS